MGIVAERLERSLKTYREKKAERMNKRFSYIKYDEVAAENQALFKDQFEFLERNVQDNLKPGRAKALVLTKLEEAYMWVGKAIRDDQIERSGQCEELKERSTE